MLQVERGGAQRDADARRQRLRRRPVAQGGQVALRRHHRVERIEQHADRRGEPHPLRRRARPLEQQRARRLQLVGERRLLADRRAIDFGDVDGGIGETRDRAQIGGVLADRLARHHAAVVAADQPRGDDRQRDIGDAAGDQQQLFLKRARRSGRRQAEHEHHRHQHLRAQRQRPAAVAGDHAGGEGDAGR